MEQSSGLGFRSDPIATFTSGTNALHGYSQTVGWAFTVNSAITVDSLYWYDPQRALTRDIQVGMWDLAQAWMIPSTDVGPVSGTWANGYWGVAIAPVTLAAGGPFVIGGLIAPGGGQTCCGVGYIGPNFGIETGTVPEPGTWIFLATGLLAFGASRRRSA